MLKNVYVTNVSLQSSFDLGKVLYKPVGFELMHNRETRFPIIPIIAEHLPEGGETKVIILRVKNSDTKDNLEVLLSELYSLGIEDKDIILLSAEESADQHTVLKMLFDMLKHMDPGSIAYFDITYGIKPHSSLMLFASQFAQKLRDVQTAGLYYGLIPRQNRVSIPGAAKIYDMTYFLSMNEMIDSMKELEFDDPEETIFQILDLWK